MRVREKLPEYQLHRTLGVFLRHVAFDYKAARVGIVLKVMSSRFFEGHFRSNELRTISNRRNVIKKLVHHLQPS